MKKSLLFSFIFTMIAMLNHSGFTQQIQQVPKDGFTGKSYGEVSEEFKYLFDNSLVPNEKQHRKYLRRAMFEYLRTAVPNEAQDFGKTLEDARLQTMAKVKAQKSARKMAGIPNVKWTERGPANVGGRARGLAYDPNDSTYRKVWTGGIAGGLFFNNNITDGNSAWQRVDLPEIISVSTITFDPSNKKTMYVGTGEIAGGPTIPGGNVWKSVDNGKNWIKLPQNLSGWTKEIVVTKSGVIIAATLSGLQRSTDGGNTFTVMLSGGTNGGNSDLEIASDGVIYAGFSGGRVFKSSDDGANWTNISPNELINERVEIALAPSTKGDSQVIYVISGKQWFKKSIDAGKTWQNVDFPRFEDGSKFDGSSATNSGQAYYDLTMSVHPKDPNFVWMGGTGIFHTTDGGKNWIQYGYRYVHPDQHNIQFSPLGNGEMVLANDGGIYYASQAGNPQKVVANFATRNKEFTVTQFYSVALRNIIGDNFIVGGAQDNGTINVSGEGKTDGKMGTGGDGAFVFVDEDDPNIVVSSSQIGTWYVQNRGSIATQFFSSGTSAAFINPADYDDVKNILYANNGNRSFARCSNINITTAPVIKQIGFKPALPAYASAIKVAKNTPNTLFVGTGGNGRIYKVTEIDKDSAITTLISSSEMATATTFYTTSNIDIGANDNELIVTYSTAGTIHINSVWFTKDGGTTWVNKDVANYGLPNVPINWAIFNPDNTKQVLVATRMGVYSSNDISLENPAWELSSEGLALTDCRMLAYRPIDGTVAVATAGRGFYTTDIFAKKVDKGTININNLTFVSACAGSTFNVSFNTTGTFGSNNRYQVVLSGEDGTFRNEFVIGTGNTSPISVIIPKTLPKTTLLEGGFAPNFVGEAKYKIKVVASQPAFESANTAEFNLKLPQADIPYNLYNTAICKDDGKVTITAKKGKTAQIQWYTFSGNATIPIPKTTDSTIIVGPGQYLFLVTENGCIAQSSVTGVSKSTTTSFPQGNTNLLYFDASNACVGKGIILRPTLVDSAIYNYRWRKNNVDIVGANKGNFQATETGSYNYAVDHKTSGCSFVHLPVNVKLREIPDVTLSNKGVSEIKYGGNATLNVSLNNYTFRPFDLLLSDNQKLSVQDSLSTVTVSPRATTIFKIASVTNLCGTKQGNGESEIKVSPFVLNTVFKSTKPFYCANEEIPVSFSTDGTPEKDNIYTVQLSDENGGNFKNIASTLSGNSLKIVLSKDSKLGNKYRVRVSSSNPVSIGKLDTDSLTVKPVAIATLVARDTSILKYTTTKLSVNLTGDAPWTIQTSDNQTITASASPQVITASPLETTTFTLKSVKDNSCGEGYVSGSAKITIIEPLSAEEEANSIFSVFPNPTENNITISLKIPSNKTTNVEMTDLQGRIIMKTLIKSGQTSETIDLEKYPVGTYLIRAIQDENQSVKKVIKIK
jgi:photosystem II stability/assembly factor-like uncharacterized protein